jgi:hypothetical protein
MWLQRRGWRLNASIEEGFLAPKTPLEMTCTNYANSFARNGPPTAALQKNRMESCQDGGPGMLDPYEDF